MADPIEELVAAARTHLDAGRLAEAQQALVAAGRMAPRDGEIYRWLGETLLRRGDAERAARVLDRAVQLGAGGPETLVWLERANAFRAMQAAAGPRVVANEVARVSAPPRELFDSMSERTTDIHVLRSDPPPPAAPLSAPDTIVSPPPALFSTPAHAPARTPAPTPAPARPPAPAPTHAPLPYPRDVLDALALSGVFEPPAPDAPPPAWDNPAKPPRRKGVVTILSGTALLLAAGAGTYFSYQRLRARDHLQAEAILAGVEARVRDARPGSFAGVEKDLARAFALESRNPRTALDWARERAAVGLVKGGADVAFEDAIARATAVGVPDEKIAFARVASFLFQGDVAGAAGLLPRWDAGAAADAWYQLVAGAVMERAGDPRTGERYAAAAKLDPRLAPARFALARATALAGDAAEAARMAADLRAAFPDRAEPLALVALAWGLAPQRGPAPPEVDAIAGRAGELPSGLRFVPHAAAALQAIERRAPDDARGEIGLGLSAIESPAAAVWLGTIALDVGDEALARRAALAAVQLSAAFDPARSLAARVALLGGRLDEALKATEGLDPASADVAVVRAAAAYERVDPDGVARALGALPAAARRLPFTAGLELAGDVLAGAAIDRAGRAKLAEAAGAGAPWADLVAVDLALDDGDLAQAGRLAAEWGLDAQTQPMRAARLARIARYGGRLDAADELSEAAIDHGTVTPRALWERAFTLVARGRPGDVRPLLARYPLVLGPLATWLSAYAAAASGAVEAAKGKTAAIDPPPATAPLEARVVAAAALGAMKDKKRGGDYVAELLAGGSQNPDLVAAALSLGFKRAERGRR